MRDDETRLGSEAAGAPAPTHEAGATPPRPSDGVVRNPEEPTIVGTSASGRTFVGVSPAAALQRARHSAAAIPGAPPARPAAPTPAPPLIPPQAPAHPLPAPPSTMVKGTAPVPVPHASPLASPPARGRNDSVAPSRGSGRSAWETFDSAPTAVHAASGAPHPGVRINQYEMIKKLGEGGMGTVFLARDLRLGRRAAIKFLQTNEPELTQRFLVEARTTARCQHDNIVVIYEVGEHEASPYIVLEFLNGKPLTAFTEDGQ